LKPPPPISDKAAFLPHYGMNRNRRCYEASAKPLKEQDKGKAVISDDPPVPPRRVRCKAVYVAELDSSVADNGTPVYKARKVRQLPDGLGSLGTRALHIKVKVGSLEHGVIKARLDSGADITLMSEEFWRSIQDSTSRSRVFG
jgi:hypothetical protein